MSVANSYAKALYQAIAESRGAGSPTEAADQLQAQMDQMLAIIHSSKEAQIALEGPITTAQEKAALVRALGQKISAAPMMSNFLVLLAMKGRLGLLGRIRDEFGAVRLTARGGVR